MAPLEGDYSRIPPDGSFAIWGTDNRGKEWFKLNEGIPAISYYTVLRDGMVSDEEDPCGLYFGTTTGQLFVSRDQGSKWVKVADGLLQSCPWRSQKPSHGTPAREAVPSFITYSLSAILPSASSWLVNTSSMPLAFARPP